MSDTLLVDVAGAAERLTMSRRTVERLAASGELLSFRVRGLRRFRVSDLEAFVEGLADDCAASPVKLTALAGHHTRNGARRSKRS